MDSLKGDGEIEVEVEKAGAVGTIWLNRPHRRNALTFGMLDLLEEAIDGLAEDDDVRVVILRGRGNTFCSGADLRDSVAGRLGKSRGSDRTARGARMCTRLNDLPKPSVAVVEGYATAGGFELMLACDLAVATSDARIGDFHINRALFPGAGPSYRLPRLIGLRRAKELMLTGKVIDGERAEAWGLINDYASADGLDARVDELVSSLADKSPYATRLMKLALGRSLETDIETMMVVEHLAVDAAFRSEDAQEGVRAFAEKRPPVWTGR